LRIRRGWAGAQDNILRPIFRGAFDHENRSLLVAYVPA
jgi:hypothetical protein